MYKKPFLNSKFSKAPFKKKEQTDTSWEKEGKSYNKLVGEDGHYYHQNLVIPGVLKLLNMKRGSSLVDIGSGQGVLARALFKDISYTGVDNSKTLIEVAKRMDRATNHQYIVASATRDLPLNPKSFSHAAIVLALQNMEIPEKAIENAGRLLKDDGRLVIVLNHPMFRIPRQTGWGETPQGLQYRYVNRYLSPLKIPILMHPSQRNSSTTISFHFSLASYSEWLNKHGFVIEKIEEWVSDKKSVGHAAKKENMARAEIPLFMAISAKKLTLKV